MSDASQRSLFGEASSSATFSPDRVYRYTLTRHWGQPTGKRVLWIGLNPSTADENIDDPTIRREISFSNDWGFDGLVKVNLFALRATNPRELEGVIDPIGGPENDATIVRCACLCDQIVAAWGAGGGLHGRDLAVMKLLRDHWSNSRTLWCLGMTSPKPPDRPRPKHPLYVAASTRILNFELEQAGGCR